MSYRAGDRVWVDPFHVGHWWKGKIIAPIGSDGYLVKYGASGMFKETVRGSYMIPRKVWWSR